MDCSNAEKLLDHYLDGEIDTVRVLEIEEHLRGCARCSESHAERQTIRQALKSPSLYFKAPPNLQSRIHRSLRQTVKAEAPGDWLWGSWLKLVAPLAVGALAMLLVVPYFSGPSQEELLTREAIASHVRSLMVNHLADVPSTDEHTVKPWFNGKLDFSPPVSDLSKQGFPLIGGRLDYLNNRPVAALVYQRDKHVINVFVWPSDKNQSFSESKKSEQGYHVIRWTSAGMNFWAVSDLEQKQLVQFTDLLKSSISAS